MGTLDDYLQLLGNEQRRQLLQALLGSEGPVTVDPGDPAAHARLYHIHLPKLESAGLVDWNRRGGTVVRGPAFDDIVPLLEAIEGMTEGSESGTTGGGGESEAANGEDGQAAADKEDETDDA
ncbi:hypothetical protein C2R22_04130 [Salinigranum rubrum]|uniref:Transcriptional regulator n=1 Tax=Salinigranum rubrum TaxID=755307 RepID=A0A2I8VG85_9EURY|nr:hypothetical protein [Salinigranum rubrum]AUV80947.1 hypothetical protein C2R22_04130 [Salinigranum rubrum]